MSENGFSKEEVRTLSALLDVIIPPSLDGVMPGAGQLGLADDIARTLAEDPAMQPPVSAGLAALDDAARNSGADDFVAVILADRAALVEGFSSGHPVLVPLLVYHTYVRYYTKVPVLKGLGLEGRTPHPEGYELEDGDFGLLGPVRDRGPMFRTVS